MSECSSGTTASLRLLSVSSIELLSCRATLKAKARIRESPKRCTSARCHTGGSYTVKDPVGQAYAVDRSQTAITARSWRGTRPQGIRAAPPLGASERRDERILIPGRVAVSRPLLRRAYRHGFAKLLVPRPWPHQCRVGQARQKAQHHVGPRTCRCWHELLAAAPQLSVDRAIPLTIQDVNGPCGNFSIL